MLDLGWTELMLIAGVAVLVISPKDLPKAMRSVGNYVGQLKRMARGFQNQVNDALRESELDDIKKSVESIGKIDPVGDVKKEIRKVDTDLRKSVESIGKIDPVGDIKKEIRKVDTDLRKELTLPREDDTPATDVPKPSTSPATAPIDDDAASPAQPESATGEAKT